MKARNVAAGEDATVVTSRPTARNLFREYWKRLVILAIILFVGSSFIIWALVPRASKSSDAQLITLADLENINTEATTVKQGQGLPAGLAVYTRALGAAANNAVRANLYLQAADLALNANQPKLALPYALKGDAILHAPDSSSVVGAVYQQIGNGKEAALFYTKAANEVGSHQISGNTKQYYLRQAQLASEGVSQ